MKHLSLKLLAETVVSRRKTLKLSGPRKAAKPGEQAAHTENQAAQTDNREAQTQPAQEPTEDDMGTTYDRRDE